MVSVSSEIVMRGAFPITKYIKQWFNKSLAIVDNFFGVLALFFALIWRFMVIAVNAPDLYGSMIVVGVIAHIGIQVFINIAVATNTIPNTGIPLPFISYGGSSLVFMLLEMGLVLSVSRYINVKK